MNMYKIPQSTFSQYKCFALWHKIQSPNMGKPKWFPEKISFFSNFSLVFTLIPLLFLISCIGVTFVHKTISVSNTTQYNIICTLHCAPITPDKISFHCYPPPAPAPTSASLISLSLWLSPHCCLCLCFTYICFLVNPSPSFTQSPIPLLSDSCQYIPCIHDFVSILFLS